MPGYDHYSKLRPSRDVINSPCHLDGEVKSKENSLSSSSGFGVRHLCTVLTTIVLLLGIFSTSYLQSTFLILLQRNSDPREVKSIPVFQHMIDTTGSDRLLTNSEEGSEKYNSSTAAKPVNSIRKDETSGEQHGKHGEADNPATVSVQEEKPRVEHPEKISTSPPVVKSPVPTRRGAVVNQSQPTTTTHSDIVDVAPSPLNTSQRKPYGRLELLPDQQNHNGRSEITMPVSSGADEDGLKSVEALKGSHVDSLAASPNSTTGRCDFTVGKWVHEPAGPLYDSNSCRVLSQPQNCQQNGRPDKGYQYYRWEPNQCSVPRLNPEAFLELMRGKTLAFVGDSLARNQMESLMCILLQAAEAVPKGSKNIHRWYFPSYKFTIVRMWSSWLVQSSGEFPPTSAPPDATKLNLTELDEYAYHLPKFDVTIISSGHWWLRKTAYFLNGELVGGMGWPWLPTYGEKKMDQVKAFGMAVNTALEKVGTLPGYKGLTIFRTYTPDHYTGGSWDTGGSCTGETKPYTKSPRNGFSESMYEKQMQAFENHTRKGVVMPNGSKLKLLDVYPILDYRGDGHPGPYRSTDPNKRTTRDEKGRPPPQDCLHWCMPGPIDSMNELMFQMLKDELS